MLKIEVFRYQTASGHELVEEDMGDGHQDGQGLLG
jgi:hypothetical protein